MTGTHQPVKVLSAGAVEHVFRKIARQFTETTGVPIEPTFRPVGVVKRMLGEGHTCDIVIATAQAIDEIARGGGTIEGSRTEIGSTWTGICVRAGARIPDISTPDKLREVLLAARSVAHSDPQVGGTSGVYLVGLMDRLGILDEVRKKAVLCRNGEDIVRRVASGEAEIGSTFVSEFPLAEGITSAGAIPAAFGNATAYAGAIVKSATASDSARRLLAAVRAPEHRELWIAGGFTPPG